jgi:hypothetical protein
MTRRLLASWAESTPGQRGQIVLGLLVNAVATVGLWVVTLGLLMRMRSGALFDRAGRRALTGLAAAHLAHRVIRHAGWARLRRASSDHHSQTGH